MEEKERKKEKIYNRIVKRKKEKEKRGVARRI
jgi:hypothetical protein